uniref:Putative secreted protein n=1 Tax=Ixodes ricinus TaxID=34613 RepID=A0A0K8RJB4_IXORI
MKATFVVIALVVMLAVTESLKIRRRSLSDEEELEEFIRATCLAPLNLSPEESAAMEKILEMQDSEDMPTADSEEDLDNFLEQVTPNKEVADSLKPKFVNFVMCVTSEFLKALGN